MAENGSSRCVFGKKIFPQPVQEKDAEDLKPGEKSLLLLKHLEDEVKRLEATYQKKSDELKKVTADLAHAEQDVKILRATKICLFAGHNHKARIIAEVRAKYPQHTP